MSITLPNGLPARRRLQDEGIEVTGDRTPRQWTKRPLRIALLNLMPEKAVAETQIARLLGDTTFHVELTLIVPGSHKSKTTSAEHISAFYEPWSRVRGRDFDGLIVTGAPVETLPFEEVDYWRELTEIFDWAQEHVHRSFYICWAAQAALYHFHGVPKHRLDQKMFGVFRHRVLARDAGLFRGIGEDILVPVSRRTEVRTSDLPAKSGLKVLMDSPDAGLCLVEDGPRRATYMFNHLEYDTDTLNGEYLRDLDAGRAIWIPRNYFPDDDPGRAPVNGWRRHARPLFRNWLSGLQRESSGDTAREGMLRWLFADQRMPSLVGDAVSEFLIVGDNSLDTLPKVLRAVGDLNLTPRAVKVHHPDEATTLVMLQLGPVGERAEERISRELLRLAETRSVAYRTTQGSGGVLVGETPSRALDSDWEETQGAEISAFAAVA